MHALSVVPDEAGAVMVALRAALSGSGPAILPAAAGTALNGLPAEVPRRVALVVQTSGSTGKPKRVALSADALLASAAASDALLGGPGQWLLALPAHYIAGVNVLVRSITAGIEPVLLPAGRFDPLAFLAAAAAMDGPARYVSLVPAQLARLLATDAALEPLRRFDRILIGGQATPTALLAQALELGLNVTRTYGSSETSGGCVYDGVPLSSTTLRIVDGQVELGGSTLAEGYLGDAERTAESFYTEAGMRWYRTGDTGELLDGVLHVTGRLDDVIISGGIKVSLGAVERFVTTLPGLADAVVIAADDERWGQVPVVVVATSTSSTATVTAAVTAADATVVTDLAALRARVTRQLGPAAAPAAIRVVESIPLLASGKPDRVRLAGGRGTDR